MLLSILYVVLFFTTCKATDEVYPGYGTFMMNGIFPVTHHGRINYQSGVMMAEAMKYAIDVINNQTNYLYGYKLGIKKIFDLHEASKVSDAVLATFMLDVPFLIGPYSSETSYITSILTRTFRQVVVSYGSSYSSFDHSDIYETYMVRTLPSNTFRMKALLTMVRRLRWNYIGVINSYGFDGEEDARYFISQLPMINACLAEQVDLPRKPSQPTYENAVSSFHLDERLKVIILFTNNIDSRHMFEVINQMKLYDRFYIVCVYGCSNYKEVVEGLERAVSGTLSLDVHNPEIEAFKEYFFKQNPHINKQRYFIKFWENLFNCSLPGRKFPLQLKERKPCPGNNKLSMKHGYFVNTPVHSVINAVYAVANATKMLLSYFCKAHPGKPQRNCSINPRDRKIYSHAAFTMLRNISFIDGTVNTMSWPKTTVKKVRYDIYNFRYENQTTFNRLVGKWEINRTNLFQYADDVLHRGTAVFELHLDKLRLTSQVINTSTSCLCSQQCPPLHKKIRDSNTLKAFCCWTCQKCPENSISRGYSCKPCKRTEVADIETNTCLALPQHHINFSDFVSITIIFLSVMGFCLATIANGLFIFYRLNSIVRASGRELSHVLLIGISLTFLCPFFYLVKPTHTTCVFRGTLPGLSFLICYAPLFLKTNRIYRIFQNAQRSVTRPNLVSPKSQLLMLLGIVAVQLLLAGVWYASKQPVPIQQVSNDRTTITIHCEGDSSPILMLLNLTLSVVFMVSCTVLAFKTRKFPKNYNEAKYMGITLYVTCVSWAVLLPAFFLVTTRFAREYMMCAICIVIGYITLFGLFTQKIKMIFYPDPNIDSNVPKMLSASHHGMKSIYLQRDISSSQQDLKSYTFTDDSNDTPPQVKKQQNVEQLKNNNNAHTHSS